MNRNSINDETDRHLILDFLRQHPGKSFEEVEIKPIQVSQKAAFATLCGAFLASTNQN